MVGRTLAHYRIDAEIGRGGMGVVYRARDMRLGRDVAIKVLPPELSSDQERLHRFEREAQILASLNHPHIAAIYGLEELEGQRFLVLELVPGATLADRLERGTVDVKEAVRVGVQIAGAMEAAHDSGVIHRDLKPGNVVLTPDGRVKVLDFGLARVTTRDVPGAGGAASPTVTGFATQVAAIVGTPAYMSPQQVRGETVDERADIWAFGVVLFEMLSGRPAFGGPTISDVMAAVLERVPDWQSLPPTCPDRLRRVVRRCLEKDTATRYRDIGDVRLDLEEALEAEATTARGEAPRTRAWTRILPWATAAAALGVAAWSLRPVEAPQPSVSEFVIELPPDRVLTSGVHPSVALSPDGSTLVYTVLRSETPVLVRRTLNHADATEINGTENASGPFFSPDGRSIGFLAGSAMKKVSLQSGMPTMVARVPPIGCGATWTADNTIVFGLAIGAGGLARVPADGGRVERLTTPDTPGGERSHCWPEMLPGGETLVFTVQRQAPGDSEIAGFDLRTSRWKTILKGGTNPRYLSTGHLLFGRARELYAVRFDRSRLEATGPPALVLENTMSAIRSGAMHIAVAQNGTLASLDGRLEGGARKLAWVDPRGAATPLPLNPQLFIAPALSPDGSKLAVDVVTANEDVWIHDFARGTMARVTTAPSRELHPVWTPDGQRLIYTSDRADRRLALHSQRTDGGDAPTPLVRRASNDATPHFANSVSPDGQWVAVTLEQTDDQWHIGDTGWDIWIFPVGGGAGEPRAIAQTPFDEEAPAISPDGRLVAFESNESGRFEVYVQAFPGPGGKTLLSTEGGEEPRWARNGRQLFYRNGERMMVVDIAATAAISASPPRLLFEGRYSRGPRNPTYAAYDVAADGRFLMMQRQPVTSVPRLKITLNWFEVLAQKLALANPKSQ